MPSEAQTLAEVMAIKPASDYRPLTTDVPAEVKEARKRDGARYFAQYCPQAFRDFNPRHPDLPPNKAAIASVLGWGYQDKGMLLTGPTGRGKTRSCWQLLNRLYAQEGHECRWMHAMDFFTSLHECMKYGRDDAKGWVSDVAWKRVIFIDDWGQEANTKAREDWAQSWFFRFIDYRLERHLPLIITTNLTAKDIAQKNTDLRGDPLLRRLLEVCNVVRFQ